MWRIKIRIECIMAKSDTISRPAVPEINGLGYHRMLRRMHHILRPDWYLEIGTFTGRSLKFAECNTVAVDAT